MSTDGWVRDEVARLEEAIWIRFNALEATIEELRSTISTVAELSVAPPPRLAASDGPARDVEQIVGALTDAQAQEAYDLPPGRFWDWQRGVIA